MPYCGSLLEDGTAPKCATFSYNAHWTHCVQDPPKRGSDEMNTKNGRAAKNKQGGRKRETRQNAFSLVLNTSH